MDIFIFISVLIGSYVLGSIPFGLVFVKLKTGQDLRTMHSGRTGGTNAGRAAGKLVGLTTAAVDFIKGAIPVWIAGMVLPGNVWLKILAPLAVIIGHNYSIFLAERNEKGRWVLRGGAGGASCVGGSLGLWAPSFLIILPLGALVFYVIGYASIATMSVAVGSALIFAVLALGADFPWQFVLYVIISEILLICALRPNLRRLMGVHARPVVLRARRNKAAQT